MSLLDLVEIGVRSSKTFALALFLSLGGGLMYQPEATMNAVRNVVYASAAGALNLIEPVTGVRCEPTSAGIFKSPHHGCEPSPKSAP